MCFSSSVSPPPLPCYALLCISSCFLCFSGPFHDCFRSFFFTFPYTPSLCPWIYPVHPSSLYPSVSSFPHLSSHFYHMSLFCYPLSFFFWLLSPSSPCFVLRLPTPFRQFIFPPDLGHAEHSDDILQFLLSASCSLFFLPFLESIFLGIYFEITCNTRN